MAMWRCTGIEIDRQFTTMQRGLVKADTNSSTFGTNLVLQIFVLRPFEARNTAKHRESVFSL